MRIVGGYEEANYALTFDEDDGDLMTVSEFLDCCNCGGFIDYDGFGNPVKDNLLMDKLIYPSRLFDIPEDATHIFWYNR